MGSVYKNTTQYFADFYYKDDILFCGGSDVESKFSDADQENLFEIEDKSWWFPYRARVIEQLAHHF